MMNKKRNLSFLIIIATGAVALITVFLLRSDIAVLNPKGIIAAKERSLIVTATLLSFIVIVPVFALTIFIAWKYRASNTSAEYTPNWDGSRILESVWWGFPFAVILVLSVITWNSSHELDPFKPVSSSARPITIQVVALQWRWLFIYPKQDMAVVNYVQFPKDTPVNFEITSDAPMNSFWIPSLGGQIYAMSGMSTQLHLMASIEGHFKGSSANISGKGFANMKFAAESTSQDKFDRWVQLVKGEPKTLNMEAYDKLSKPSEDSSRLYYSSKEPGLYDKVISKYMMHMQHAHVHGADD